MSGQVRIWQSFSCNNSSNYRLIARFSDATKAAEVAAELEALRHQPPQPAAPGGGPSHPLGTLAQALGFDWDEWFPYGDAEDPTVAAEAEVLAVYHSYCLGFPEAFTTWLSERGGEVEPQHGGTPQISALFALPESGPLREDLAEVFADAAEREAAGQPMHLPWAEREQWGVASFFCDGESVGFSAPIVPADLRALRRWLAERGVLNPVLRLCAWDDAPKFATIARAVCSGCGSGLRYVEPKRFGIDAEQLACAQCGAMYELAVVRAATEPKVG